MRVIEREPGGSTKAPHFAGGFGGSCGRVISLEASREDRWRAVTFGGPTVAVLAVGLAAFGIPSTPFMQPLYALGLVLPGCGLTRGTVALASGDPAMAWDYNPASFVVAAGVVAAVARDVAFITVRRWVHVRVHASPTTLSVALGVAIIAVALLWVRQQAHADLLIR